MIKQDRESEGPGCEWTPGRKLDNMASGPTEIRYMGCTMVSFLIGGSAMLGGFFTGYFNASLEDVASVFLFIGFGFMFLTAVFSVLYGLKGIKEKRLGYSTAHNELGRVYVGKDGFILADRDEPEISIKEIIRRNRLNRESATIDCD